MKRVRPEGTCKLCFEAKPLCNSHIVPEWMYSTMYDPVTKKFFGLSANSDRDEERFQKGIREYLLCDDCEGQIGKYEDYAARVFKQGIGINCEQKDNFPCLSGVEYRRFKLFTMSLLWRFAVTDLEYFRGMNLGPYEEKLRLLLQAEDPGTRFQFPCVMTAIMWDNVLQQDLILPPMPSRLHTQTYWSIAANGILFSFVVNRKAPPTALQLTMLKEDGTMTVVIREAQTMPMIWDRFMAMGKAQKTRSLRKKAETSSLKDGRPR